MKNLLVILSIGFLASNLVVAQTIDLEKVQPNIMNMDAISAFYEMNDIRFYDDIINTPQKALEYEGDSKIAANLGVYMADMIYGIGTRWLEVNNSVGAVMELSRKLGIEDNFPQAIIDRINDKDVTADQASAAMNDVLKNSKNDFTKTERTEIFNYILYGNYIEKLYQVSSLLKKAESIDLPESAKANLNRNLLVLMAKQGQPLAEVSKLMSNYSSDLIAYKDLETLLDSYEKLAKDVPEIVKLSPEKIYTHSDIVDIHKKIGKIRERIVQ